MAHPSFASAWLARDPHARTFLPDACRDPQQRAHAADLAARPVDPRLVQALRRIELPADPQRDRHLDLLGQPGTIAVVTGQQLGLCLGPLYTIYKAAAAIVGARQLSRETGHPCVPVFWLQTEDHDFPEIDHTFLPRTTGPLKLALEDAHPDQPRMPVAHRQLGPSVLAVLDALEAELLHQPHGPALMDLLRDAYRPEATLVHAFCQVLAQVFQGHGLVFVDPRDPAVAAVAAPVHRTLLLQAEPLARVLGERAQALEAAGFPPQVHIRPGAPLSFYSPDGAQGPRFRLQPQGPETWALVADPGQRTVTTQALLADLAADPLRFSTSALSRPLLQDTLLPTVAYVGGPGELAYFAQLGPAYQHLGLPMPLVVPRARFRVLDDRTRGLLQKLGLTPDDAARPREDLLKSLADHGEHEPPEALRQRLTAAIDPQLAGLEGTLAALDPNLPKALARTREAVHDSVGKLVEKVAKALALRDQVTVERVDRLQAFLLPQGQPQERVLGLPYFAARYGIQGFAQQVIEACEPFCGDLKDLAP